MHFVYGFNGRLVSHGLDSETGRILSRWEDAGWGKVVADENMRDISVTTS